MTARILALAVAISLLQAIDLWDSVSLSAKDNNQNVTITRIFRVQDKDHNGVLQDEEIESARRVVRGSLDVACDRIESHPRLRRIPAGFDRKRVFAAFADTKIDEDGDGRVSEDEFSRFYRSVHEPILEAQRAMQNGAAAEVRPADPGVFPGAPPSGGSGRRDKNSDRDRDRDRELDQRERELHRRQLEERERQRNNDQQQRAAAERAARDREMRDRQQQEQQRQREQADRRRADEERRRDAERRERDAQQQRRALDARKNGR